MTMYSRSESKRSKGFTLIEVMIVVAIVAVLAAIAYPSYRDSVLKGRRAQARTALLDLMQQQERYMTQFNTYLKFTTSATGTVSPTPADGVFKNYAGDSNVNPPYWLSAAECTGNNDLKQCIQLTAVPTQTDALVGNLTLTSTGVKSCSITSNMRLCWP